MSLPFDGGGDKERLSLGGVNPLSVPGQDSLRGGRHTGTGRGAGAGVSDNAGRRGAEPEGREEEGGR
ncbi:hypothetical protein E2C01_085896 [Portunus trituberculatus]|uniref:Uncharacterized protein n=1 Tax=Portunus trituberculatus TaxID=210409 RepID=A0A5B7J3X9_PORTR|nr:hypothetical protein [Portunus trituberculatus]